MTEAVVAEVEAPAVRRNGADPAQVRPQLAEAAAASLDDIQAALLDAALGSVRPVWITHACRNRAQKERIEVQVPDVRSRVAAIELLLREGLGRPPQAEEAATPRMPRRAEDVSKLSWDDLQMIFATQFAGEIAAVAGEGDALLRERVAALDEGQRQLRARRWTRSPRRRGFARLSPVVQATVESWSYHEGWGVLLAPEVTSEGVWAHFSAVEMDGFKSLTPGQAVEIEVEDLGEALQDRYRYRATRVRPIN